MSNRSSTSILAWHRGHFTALALDSRSATQESMHCWCPSSEHLHGVVQLSAGVWSSRQIKHRWTSSSPRIRVTPTPELPPFPPVILSWPPGGAVAAVERSARGMGPGPATSWSSSWAVADANAARLPSTKGGGGEEDGITTYRDSDATRNQAMLPFGRSRGRIAAGSCRVLNRERERALVAIDERAYRGFFFACAAKTGGFRTS